MSDKYITSLLLIRMLKAFLRVTLNHNSLIHTVTNTIALKFCMFEAVPSIQNSHCSRMQSDSYILQSDSYIYIYIYIYICRATTVLGRPQ